MSVQLGTCFTILLGVVYCYENICRKTTCTATQSSTRYSLAADKVIDGIIQQRYTTCSYTAVNESEAWVMVDLGKEYKLKNIVIYYIDEEKWKLNRLRQYGLEVSNTSCTKQWTQCYKDETAYPDVPESIQNISCEKEARYVRVITIYDAPEDDKYSEMGPVLEICEIKIYGFYGKGLNINTGSMESTESTDFLYAFIFPAVVCLPLVFFLLRQWKETKKIQNQIVYEIPKSTTAEEIMEVNLQIK